MTMLLESPLASRTRDFIRFAPGDDGSDSDESLVDDPDLDDDDDASAASPTRGLGAAGAATVAGATDGGDAPPPMAPAPRASRLALLPILTFAVDTDTIPRILPRCLAALVAGDHPGFDAVEIIDCRFDYEFSGGHIDGAVNLLTMDELEQRFFGAGSAGSAGAVLYVFHCEFLVYRGPNMAGRLRLLDRAHNLAHYPALSYPDVVVLDGGYKEFQRLHPSRCGGYVAMSDGAHAETCAALMNRARSDAKLIKRAKLYHFNHPHHALVAAHARLRLYTAVGLAQDKVVKRVRLKRTLFSDGRRPPPTPLFGDLPLTLLMLLVALLALALVFDSLALLLLSDSVPMAFEFPPPSLLAKLLRARLLHTPKEALPMALPFLTLVEDLAALTHSFIDPINDLPVDFSVPMAHKRNLSALTLMLYLFVEE